MSDCKHEWFRTGAMEPSEMRCTHCGEWGHKVDRDTFLLRQALEALEHHVEQTRPIHWTSETIAALRERLGETK